MVVGRHADAVAGLTTARPSSDGAGARAGRRRAPASRSERGDALRRGLAPAVAEAEAPAGEALALSLVGQDRPGIVNQVTSALGELGANIESFETRVSAEPHSGAPLFHLDARLRLPPGLASDAAQTALEAISGEIMVDITLAPAG